MVSLDREARVTPKASASHLKTIGTLLPYLWPKGEPELRARVLVAVVFLIAAKLANVYVPFLYKGMVDALSGKAGPEIVIPIGLLIGYGLLRVANVGFAELRDAVFAKVAERAIRTVSLRVFEHLHRLSLRFHLERRTGGLSRAIERGSKGIEFLLTFMTFNTLPTLVEITMVSVVLWGLYGIEYAAVTFGTIAIYIAFTLSVTEWRIKYRRRMNEKDSEANTKAIDSLLNYETVKYFGNEAHEAHRFDESRQAYEKAAISSKTSLSLLNIGQGAIIAAGVSVLMLMAGVEVTRDTMTVGDFVLVNTYLIQLYIPLNFLGFVYREMKQSLIDMEAMFTLLNINVEVGDKPDSKALAAGPGEIRFDHVSFSYEARRRILDDVSFTVSAGTTLAVVGASGAGKSTISRILFRFYDIEGGRVTIDGQDIRDVQQASLRAAIGIVPQDTVLFNDTIYYNIAYGRPGATKDEIEAAARLARIHDFVVTLPDGYRTMVGERGLKLSGGEKQRVAIARTILKNPRILLFDEATSALDSKTEKEIQASLREVSANRTTIVIAHRLSTVVDADQIIVLDNGRLVESGRHAELLSRDGRYAEMWRRQQETAEIEAQLSEVLAAEAAAEPAAE